MTTIFTKIINKEIPCDIVFENDRVLAFRDIAPQAPVHILIIPKIQIKDISNASEGDKALLGEILLVAAQIAKNEGIEDSGYRVVTNKGEDGGQTVFHLHFHLLGGRALHWPPG